MRFLALFHCLVLPLILFGCGTVGNLTPSALPKSELSFPWLTNHPPTSNEEGKLTRAILDAQDPSKAAPKFAELFKSGNLKRLQMNASPTIAVQAAWEEVEHTVPAREPVQVVRPDAKTLVWFVGVLEAKACIHTPKWWADAILDCRANRRGNIYAGGINMMTTDEAAVVPTRPPPQARFDKKDGIAVIQLGSVTAPIPSDLSDRLELNHLKDRVSALITPSRVYVAVYDSWGYPFRLASVVALSANSHVIPRLEDISGGRGSKKIG
jgi:hypothetical protein